MPADLEALTDSIFSQVNDLHAQLFTKPWEKHSRIVFVKVLKSSVAGLKELKDKVTQLDKAVVFHSTEVMPKIDVDTFLRLFDSSLRILEKNLFMETTKKTPGLQLNPLMDEIEVPELYSSLEQRVMELLLKTRYFVEHYHVKLKSENVTPINKKRHADNLSILLDDKAKELDKLRSRYQELQSQVATSRIAELKDVDLEHDLHKIRENIAGTQTILTEKLSHHNRALEDSFNAFNRFKKDLNDINQFYSEFLGKTNDLVLLLKKERDYARRIVLQSEFELTQLKNTYSRKLLDLEKDKSSYRQDLTQDFNSKLRKVERELKETKDNLEHFKRLNSAQKIVRQ
ncbi:MAG: hypothetical protein ABH821_03110 [archaeon]